MAEYVCITCPCCGYKTISSTYDICDICYWENDPVQAENPDMKGANHATLREAQVNFVEFGAAERRFAGTEHVRPPGPDDQRDPAWKPLDSIHNPE